MSFREIGISIVDLVRIFAIVDVDDWVAGIVVTVVPLADIVFHNDYLVVWFSFDVVYVASLAAASVVVVDDADVTAAVHVHAQCLSNNMWINDPMNFVDLVEDLYVLFPLLLKLIVKIWILHH